jgi:hypothetical protein
MKLTVSELLAALDELEVSVILKDGVPTLSGSVKRVEPWLLAECKRLKPLLLERLQKPEWNRDDADDEVRRALQVWESEGCRGANMEAELIDEAYEAREMDLLKQRVQEFIEWYKEPVL